MAGGASSTVVYDVVTRYVVEDHSSAGLGRYARATHEADRSTRGLRASTGGLGASTRYASAAFVPFTGGLTLAAAAGAIAVRTFQNLNDSMVATNQLAAQVNLAARFSPDRVENFNRSLVASRGLMRGLADDASRLPGDLSDFKGIAQGLLIPTVRAGGSLEDLRALTGRIALAGPALGQSPEETANQTRRILLGGMGGLGNNPMVSPE